MNKVVLLVDDKSNSQASFGDAAWACLGPWWSTARDAQREASLEEELEAEANVAVSAALDERIGETAPSLTRPASSTKGSMPAPTIEPKLGWLKALVKSAWNCRRKCSEKLRVLKTARLRTLVWKSRRMLRPALPKGVPKI